MEWRECQRFVSNDRKNKEEMCRTTQSHTFVRFVAPFSICIRPKSGGRIELDPLYFGYPLSEWFQFFYYVRIERQKNHFFFFGAVVPFSINIARTTVCTCCAPLNEEKKYHKNRSQLYADNSVRLSPVFVLATAKCCWSSMFVCVRSVHFTVRARPSSIWWAIEIYFIIAWGDASLAWEESERARIYSFMNIIRCLAL